MTVIPPQEKGNAGRGGHSRNLGRTVFPKCFFWNGAFMGERGGEESGKESDHMKDKN